jgi:hypothetical protein
MWKLFQRSAPKGKRLTLDWEDALKGSAPIGTIPLAVKDLHLRLLALEGRSEEAERLKALLQD